MILSYMLDGWIGWMGWDGMQSWDVGSLRAHKVYVDDDGDDNHHKHHDHDHDYYPNNQVGSNHYPECQVFRTLNPKLVVSDFEEEGNVIYQVKLSRDIMDKENACLNCSVW